MNKIWKTWKVIWKWFSAVFATLCILCTALLVYTAAAKAAGNPLPTIFGWGGAVVISGSMEPELPIGSFLWIHRQNTYSPGDVVTYAEGNRVLVTHRLVSVSGNTAITKGDANNTEDSPIAVTQICGKVSAVWPGVGDVLLFLKSPAGMILLFVCGGLILFLSDRLEKKGKVS